MAPSESRLLDVVTLAYDAAQAPEIWNTFLERYANVLRADGTVIQRHRFGERTSRLQFVFGMEDRFSQSYHEHFSRLNVWRNLGRSQYVQGRVLRDEEICTRPVLVASEFYNDYLLPMGGIYSAAGVIERVGDEALMLTALRGRRKHGWHGSERKTMAVVLPHVMRAYAASKCLSAERPAESFLNTMPCGIVFVSSHAELVYANAKADRMLRTGDGITVSGGRVRAVDPQCDAEIRTALDGVSRGPSLAPPPASVSLIRRSGRRPLCATIGPVLHGVPAFKGMRRAEAVMVLTDPESRERTRDDILKGLYGLTDQEARLVSILSSGASLQNAADALAVSIQTARKHLQSVFRKTGASRQAELIALLAQLPARQLES